MIDRHFETDKTIYALHPATETVRVVVHETFAAIGEHLLLAVKPLIGGTKDLLFEGPTVVKMDGAGVEMDGKVGKNRFLPWSILGGDRAFSISKDRLV